MPKYAVHTIVMEKTAERLSATGQSEKADLLVAHRDIAAVGAIGPDIFFWAPDYTISQTFLTIFDAWDSLVRLYDESIISDIVETMESIKESADNVLEATIGPSYELIKHLVEEFKETADLFEQTVKYGALSAAVGVDNLVANMSDLPSATHRIFDVFKPPLQDGKSERDWYWFDMLHYRYAGDFAGNLLANAVTPEQKAYAYSYLTHIATDLIGHGYVNQIVGGPYRTQVQRHVVMENFLDSWALAHYRDKDISTELVDYLNFPGSLPGGVVDLLDTAFVNTYNGKAHPRILGGDGFLSKTQIEDTYRLFTRITRLLENKIEKPREPFSDVLRILEDALKDFTPPPSPPNPWEGDCDFWDFLALGFTERSRECYRRAAEAIAEFFEYLGELLAWTFESIAKIFQFLLALPLAATIAVVLALLYAIQLSLYKVLTTLRDFLALSGILYPSPGMVYTGHGRNLLIPCFCNACDSFPHTYFGGNCLECPDSELELPQTVPSWYVCASEGEADESQVKALMESLITEFIENKPLNLPALAAYAGADSPGDTRNLYTSLGGGGESGGQTPPPTNLPGATGQQAGAAPNEIGSAVELANWMVTNPDEPVALTNWNLDSDRGYAYKQWAGELPSDDIADEAYI
jgi:hypothetical protein